MKVGAITGGIGDCVYAIPVMRKLGITRLYIKEDFYEVGEGSKYTVMKPLLESQGIECLPTTGNLPLSVFEPGLKYDIDLDEWRVRGGRNRVHIMKNMMLHYRCYSDGWEKPWLHNIKPVSYGFQNAIFVTPRWRDNSEVSWVRQMYLHGLDSSNTCFLGHKIDYEYFKEITGFWHPDVIKDGYYDYRRIMHVPTSNLLELAQVIAGCKRLFCNQCVALTIAQGLGKEYWLERKPGKTNTLLFTPNEHLL